MKKIGCNLCAGEYTIETHNSEQIRFCPFCGEPLEDYINIEEEDDYMDKDEWEEFEE